MAFGVSFICKVCVSLYMFFFGGDISEVFGDFPLGFLQGENLEICVGFACWKTGSKNSDDDTEPPERVAGLEGSLEQWVDPRGTRCFSAWAAKKYT